MISFHYEIAKPKQDGSCSVYILFIRGKEKKRIKTYIAIGKEDFNKSGQLKNKTIINSLEGMIIDYRRKCNEISHRIYSMSMDDIYNFLTDAPKTDLDFFAVFRQYIAEHNGKLKGISNYQTAYNSLFKYNKEIREEDILEFSEITFDLLMKYEKYLGNGRRVSLYMGCIRHVYKWAMIKYNDEGRGLILIPPTPFARYKVPKDAPTRKRAVEVDVIHKIMELPYEQASKSRFNLAKDCFLLSFFLMGINSADLYNCKIFRNGTIEYKRTKTTDRRADGAETHVDVDERILPLFNKYRDETGERVFSFYKRYVNCKDFNRYINKGLKLVGAAIGVPDLTYYAARHSWATIARNDLGIDKGTIDEALVHVGSYSVLDIYIKKDFKQINKANKAVIDYVLGERHDVLSDDGKVADDEA